MYIRSLLLGLAAIVAASPAFAADTIRVGHLNTFTGPFGVLGIEMKRGLELAQQHLGNKLGGVPMEIYETDEQSKPDIAVQAATKMIDKDKVHIITGLLNSAITMAVTKPAIDAGVTVISANSGPSVYAGEGCNANFFATAFQNDAFDEAAGEYMTKVGIKKLFLAGADYQAGYDHLNGAKRTYKGTVVREIFTPNSQLDFSAEMAQIRSDKPDALFTFYPGALGAAFIKQWAQAGLNKTTRLFTGIYAADDLTFKALGDSAIGMEVVGNWYPALDNPENKKFVAAFKEKFGRNPTMMSAGMYDAIMLMDAAVKQVGGKVEDRPAFTKALHKADYKSIKGAFKFNVNNYPIQNYQMSKVVKGADGNLTYEKLGELKDHKDSYYEKCKLTW
jgi:branched-chain amino acid transport system substrate-binding protein